MASQFSPALRGYDMAQVDQLLAQADAAVASGSESERAAAREALRNATFRRSLRGYHSPEVDDAVEQRLKDLG